MARIRTVKPDFWTDEKLTECSVTARLLFIGTWNFADDKGNLQRSSKKLKMQIFPADVLDCEPLIQELISHGVLLEYSVNGDKYLHIKNFLKHQKINKPSESRIPLCPLPDDSGSTPVALPHGREGKGKEGKVENIEPPFKPPLAITQEMLDLIRLAHPRGTDEKPPAEKAIRKAILREVDTYGSVADSARYLYKRTKLYAQCVSEWPPGEKDFVPLCATWFNKERYTSEATWRKHGKADKTQERVERNREASVEGAALLGICGPLATDGGDLRDHPERGADSGGLSGTRPLLNPATNGSHSGTSQDTRGEPVLSAAGADTHVPPRRADRSQT